MVARISGISVKIDQKKAEEVSGRVGREASRRAAETARENARRNIRRAGRMNTGRMHNEINIGAVMRGRRKPTFVEYQISADTPYSIYQEKGTRGSKARPGGVLAFMPKGSNVMVFVKSTGPVKGIHFMERAIKQLTLRDFMP